MTDFVIAPWLQEMGVTDPPPEFMNQAVEEDVVVSDTKVIPEPTPTSIAGDILLPLEAEWRLRALELFASGSPPQCFYFNTGTPYPNSPKHTTTPEYIYHTVNFTLTAPSQLLVYSNILLNVGGTASLTDLASVNFYNVLQFPGNVPMAMADAFNRITISPGWQMTASMFSYLPLPAGRAAWPDPGPPSQTPGLPVPAGTYTLGMVISMNNIPTAGLGISQMYTFALAFPAGGQIV